MNPNMYLTRGLGTRQAFVPGLRTGAPGKHVVRGKAKYRLIDEKVRVFVAPAIETIQNTNVRLPLCDGLLSTLMTWVSSAATICEPQGQAVT